MYVQTQTVPPSREARELAELLTAAIDAYQARNPGMSSHEIEQALRLARPPSKANRAAAIIGVLVGIAALVGFGVLLVMSATSR